MESNNQEQPAHKTCTCPTQLAAATWQCEELRRDMMTNRVVPKSKRSKTSSDDSNLARGPVRARGDEDIREETIKPKFKCVNLCNVDVQNMESKLIENDPTFEVTSSQQSGETRQALKTHQHQRMRYITESLRILQRSCQHSWRQTS